MHVARHQLPGGPAESVRDADHDGFLHRQHVAHLRVVREGVHDRQFSRAGIAEHAGNALIQQRVNEGVAAANRVHGRRIRHRDGALRMAG